MVILDEDIRIGKIEVGRSSPHGTSLAPALHSPHSIEPCLAGSEWSSEFQRFFRLHGQKLRTPLQSRSAATCFYKAMAAMVFLQVKSTGKEQVCTKFIHCLSNFHVLRLSQLYFPRRRTSPCPGAFRSHRGLIIVSQL